MSRAVVALLFADVLFFGVRSTVERKGPALPPREKDCQIEFIQSDKADPAREVIGTIQVYIRRNIITMGRQAVYEEAVPEFRKQACKPGATAVVVLQQTVSRSGEFKLLSVKADAIRTVGEPSGK